MSDSSGRDPGLLVLISLAGGPRHGHAILLDVAEFAKQRLGPGTLYGAIARLEEAGLIEALPEEGRRRPYRLTAQGAVALKERLTGLDAAVRVGLRRIEAA
jgi:DNA-binding PadR family transcriptional regulator